jgi:hypothetical protein
MEEKEKGVWYYMKKIKNMPSQKSGWKLGCLGKLFAALSLVLVVAMGMPKEVSAMEVYTAPEGKTTNICVEKGTTVALFPDSPEPYRTEMVWKSSNTSIVSVKNKQGFMDCEITTKKSGTATVSTTYKGKTYKFSVYVGEHSWNGGVKTKKGTCTTAGEKTYTCTRCKATRTEATKKVHSYQKVKTVEATKKHRGYDLMRCSKCKKEKKTNIIHWQTTEEEVYACLMKMKKKYPQGTKWGKEEGECDAFATMLVYDAFGYLGKKYHWDEDIDPDRELRQDIENIRVGDVLSTTKGYSGHLQVVQKVLGKGKFLLAEGNYNGTVNWERIVSFKYNEHINRYSYAGNVFWGYYTFYADLPDEK